MKRSIESKVSQKIMRQASISLYLCFKPASPCSLFFKMNSRQENHSELSVYSQNHNYIIFGTFSLNLRVKKCLKAFFKPHKTIRLTSGNRKKNTSKTIMAQAYQSRCCFWRSSSVLKLINDSLRKYKGN